MAFVTDTFTDVDGTLLQNHTGETGATWTKHPDSTAANFVHAANRIYGPDQVDGSYYASGLPATAEYDVSADFHVVTLLSTLSTLGRVSVTANTFYLLQRNEPGNNWRLLKRVAGSFTVLGQLAQTLTVGQTYATKLEIRDAAKKIYVDGVELASSTDNAITDAGRVGLRTGVAQSATTGIHIDNLSGEDAGAGGISGDGAGALVASGSAAGTVLVQAAGAGALGAAAAAAGSVLVQAAGSATLVLTGAGDGSSGSATGGLICGKVSIEPAILGKVSIEPAILGKVSIEPAILGKVTVNPC